MIDSPFGGAPEKAQDGISWVRKFAVVEIGFRGAPGCFQGIRLYIGEGSRSVESRGAHDGGGAPRGAGAPPCHVAFSFLS